MSITIMDDSYYWLYHYKGQKTYAKFIRVELLNAAEADQAKQEYLKVLSSVVVTDKEKFRSFDQDCLDGFLVSLMQANADFMESL